MADYLLGRSLFLMAMPSAVSGAGRLLDFGGTMDAYNEARGPEEADGIAVAMDWGAVGDDLGEAFQQCAREAPEEVRDRLGINEVTSVR